MSLRLRAVAYSPNGARLGPLPAPQDLQASMVLGDVGAFSLSYPLTGPRAPFLASACEVAVEVSYDDGLTWTEPNDARFLRLRRQGDQVDAPNVVSYGGPSYLWLLDKSPVLPEGALNAEGKRAFLTATVGTIMRTLIQEAQARGELPGMDASTFSAATDSNGAAWASVITIYYDPGMSYLTILRNLFDQGLCDFTMVGRSLRLYKPGTVMGGASTGTLRKGRDLTEAPYQGTLEGIASHAFLLGDGGVSFERDNPTAPQPWGRWTSFISQGGVSDTGTMTVITDATLAQASAERVENTYGLDFSRAKSLPFRDYSLGKTVQVAAGNAVPDALRVRQITLTRDEKGLASGNVVLNDRFLEAEVSQARRIAGITGGSTADGGSGARPNDGIDRSVPKAPTGLTAGSVAYLDDEGKVWAQVTLDWADVTQNTDNTAITDLAGYEAQWSFQGSGVWQSLPLTEASASIINASSFQPNTAYSFRVRAFDSPSDRLSHKSAWSATVNLTTANDATAPGKPAAATVSAYLGQLLIDWSGLLDAGGPMPLDFDRAEVHLSTVNGFAPSAATLLDTITSKVGGQTVATGLTYGTPYYVKVVVYDRAGNVSPASNQSTGTPVKMGGIDLDAGAVGYDALAYKQSGNLVPDGTFEDQVYRDDLTNSGAMNAGWSWQNVAGNATSGRWSLALAGATGSGTQRNVRLSGTKGVAIPGVAVGVTGIRVSPGEKWLVRFQAKGTTNGGLGAFFTVYGADGAFISFVLSAPMAAVTGAFATLSAVLTMPAGAAYAVPFLEAKTTITTGTTYVDDVEIRPVIGTLLVDDAAITNAKIASMVADKVTAGALSAAITISGRIATALTGARVELNNTGLKAYDAGGVNTVAINTDGSATITGMYRTAASGRRMEISADALGNSFGADGQHSIRWTPTTLTAGWSPAGIFAIAGTAGGASGNGLLLMSSNKTTAPNTGSNLFLGMNGISMDSQPVTTLTGEPATFTMTPDSGTGSSVYLAGTDTSLGSGGPTGTVSIQGGTSVSINTSAGNIYIYERSSATEALAIRNDGTAYVRSQTIYARTSTAAVNITISSFGTIARSTSLERYKVAIDREWADKVDLAAIKGLTPASYYDRQQAERFAAWLDPDTDQPDENVELPRLNLGLIAEDVEALGLLGLTNHDENGDLNGVAYERVAVALIPWLRDLERRLAAQEARYDAVGSSA